MGRRRTSNPRDPLVEYLEIGAVALAGLYLYGRLKNGGGLPGLGGFNPAAILNPVTGRSPSGLAPGDPGFSANVPAGF